MYLNQYLANNNYCLICNSLLKCCASYKHKQIKYMDGYFQIEYDLIKPFHHKSFQYPYSYKYIINYNSYHFYVDFTKNNKPCDYVPTSIINKFNKSKDKECWVYKSCPSLCCSVSSNSINFNLSTGTINPLFINSYDLNLNQEQCRNLNLPFKEIKMISSKGREYSYLSLSNLNAKNTYLEYSYHIPYQKVNAFLNKLPEYLLLT